jgi:hypothetical protein
MTVLSADELLAGADATYRVVVPARLRAGEGGEGGEGGEVVLRPLLLADVVRLQRATAQTDQLASVMMVQQSLVEPALTVDQVHRLPAGIVEFLLGEVNRISGLTLSADDLQALVHEPLARACLVLARQFGWTPDQCATLTVGQLLLYLEMAERGERP